VKYLARVNALTEFLRAGTPSLESIIRFVVLDTLYDFSAMTIFLNVVWSDGSVHIPAYFGCDPEHLHLIPARSVTIDTPVNKALRTGKIVECGSYDQYLFAGPEYSRILFPRGFPYSVAWPIPDFGVAVTFCEKVTVLTPKVELFIQTIGSIISLHLSQGAYKGHFKKHLGGHDPVTSLAFTSRQWKILEALRGGSTNSVIADKLGVSESLVRQETVRIYRNLGVSGRKEILATEAVLNRRGNRHG